MKNLRQIVSLVLFSLMMLSAVFNILYLFDKIDKTLTQIGFLIYMGGLFIISLTGLILKNRKKEDTVEINIATPVKEMGFIYVLAMFIWFISYAVILIFR